MTEEKALNAVEKAIDKAYDKGREKEKSKIVRGTEIKEKPTVGQEFMEWAEKYWLLDKLVKIENLDEFTGEKCDYNHMRNIFIEKINGIIKDRLG